MIAASLRFFSGRLADRTHAYWTLAIAGYALNVLAIPALAFVHTWQAAAVLITIERTGKALRGPARDLLLSEATGKVGHGFGFGVHAVMDQTGACAGPLLMAVLAARYGRDRPGIRLAGDSRRPRARCRSSPREPCDRYASSRKPVKASAALPPVFWPYIVGAGLLACGFIDFPVLGAHFEKTHLFVAGDDSAALFRRDGGQRPDGVRLRPPVRQARHRRLADRHRRSRCWRCRSGFFGGDRRRRRSRSLCWAIGLGVQDASLRAGIAQVVSMNKRGTAFGTFNGVYGVMWFLGSSAMGALYTVSLPGVVAFGVVSQLAGAAVFLRLRRRLAAAATAPG